MGGRDRLSPAPRFNEGMALLHLEPLPPRTSKGDLLALLQDAGGLRRDRVGKIDLRGTTAAIEVPEDWVARLVKALDGVALRDRKLRAWSAAGASKAGAEDDPFLRLARLLNLESEAEVRQRLEEASRGAEAERRGESLSRLVIAGEDSGLGGRCLLTLSRRDRSQPLPWNRFEPGAPVVLAPE